MEEVILLPIPIVIAFGEFLKMLGVPAKYVPLFSVFAGVVLALGFNNFEINFNNVLTGIVYGFSAVGLYSGVKNTLNK